MINPLIYIWSRDRACQLETLLYSIDQNDIDWPIEVLYSWSNDKYLTGYKVLRDIYPEVKWSPKSDGKSQLLSSIKENDYFTIVTDDCWFFNKPTNVNLDDVFTFSLRLGLNTIVQDHFAKTYQPILIDYIDENETIKWSIVNKHPLHNYGYPFSMDGHIYRSSDLIPLLESINFTKPSELEGNLLQFRPYINPFIRANRHSSLVNIPITNMSQQTKTIGIENSFLNTEFLNDRRLRYKSESIVGAHQNLEWELC